MQGRVKLVLALLLFIFTTTVFAEDKKCDINDWSPPSAGPVTAWTAPLCEKGKLALQLFFFYTNTRGTFDSQGNSGSLGYGYGKYQNLEQLFMVYGLTDKLELDLQTEYQENYKKEGELKAHSRGLGDSYAFLRYCLFEETKTLPHITGIFQVKAPTGKYQKADPDKLGTDLTGAGSWDPGYGIIFTKKIKPFIFHLDTIASFPNETKIDGLNTRYGNYLNYDFGVEYFLPKGFNLLLEFNGFTQANTKEDNARSPGTSSQYVMVAPGIGWSNDKIQTLVAYQRTLTGKNADANDSLVLTFVYCF